MKKVVLVSQMFFPDEAATAKIMTDIAVGIARDGFSVDVFCQDRSYLDPSIKYAEEEKFNNINIHRIRLPKLSKDSIAQRILLFVIYTIGVFLKLRYFKADIYVSVSNPPWIGFFVSKRAEQRRKPFLFIVHDLYPDLLVNLGKIKKDAIGCRILKQITQVTLDTSYKIVVLGRDVCDHLVKYYNISTEKIEVIANWPSSEIYRYNQINEIKNAISHDIKDKFLILYSGNIGETANFDVLLSAAEQCAVIAPQVEFIIIGEGKKKTWLQSQIVKKRIDNVKITTFLKVSEYAKALSEASAFFVSLNENLAGISVPSKTYTYLAAGKPLLVLVPKNSEIAIEVFEDDFGILLSYSAKSLIDAILLLSGDQSLYERKSNNARKAFENKYNKSTSLLKYSNLLKTIANNDD